MIYNKLNIAKKHLIKIIALLVVAVSCFACSIVGMIGFANEATLSNVEIASQYNLGQEVVISDGTVTVAGKNYTVKPTVCYPDGTAYTKNNYLLNQLGKYSVVYGLEVDGEYYSVNKEFQVYDYLFSNSSSGEAFTYGYDTQESLAGTEREIVSGLRFDLLQGEEFKYNKVIDLREYEKDDTLIMLDAVPVETQKRDVTVVFITLTDVYDPSNVVSIRLRQAPDSPNVNYSYINAVYGDHPYEGYQNGRYYYGKGFDNGLNGRTKSTAFFDIRFDYVSKCIYSYNTARNGLVLVKDMVNDYGNEPWGGFTTGEVWLTVSASGYVSTDVTAPFHGMLLEIDGLDLTGKEEGTFDSSIVTTTNAQDIVFGEYQTEKNIPKAMVGYAYKVFDTEFLSIYGGEKLYTNVYYAYTSSSRYEVPVVNGYFTPDKVGVYTIVYTTVDVFGNMSVTTLDVTATPDNGYGIYVEVPGYENHMSGNVGERVELVDASEVVTLGNLGFVDVTITASQQDGSVVNVTANDFVPQKGGTWLITYTVKDYAGRVGKFSYELEVQVSDKVVFGQVKDMLKYFVVGTPNPVPELQYIDYNENNPVYKTVTKVYAEKDGDKVGDVIGGYFTPTVEGQYYIVYEQTSSVNTEEPNLKKVPVYAVDVGYGGTRDVWNRAKYFYSPTNDIIAWNIDGDGSTITVDDNGSFEFIRPVDVMNLDISFTISKINKAASKFSITMTDINNANEQVKISFINNGGSSLMLINETQEVVLAKQEFNDVQFILNFKNAIATVGTEKGIVSTYLNGAKYQGFSSLLAYLTFEVEVDAGVTGKTSITFDEINAQPFQKPSNNRVDRLVPRIVVSGSYLNKMKVGDVVRIPRSTVIDVLTPSATATLTIMGPNDIPVVDVKGRIINEISIEEDYDILLSEAGSYRIYYSYRDAAGNVSNSKYPDSVIVAASKEKPVITISGGARTAKVGEWFTVGSATCTGSFDNYNLYIFVLAPTGNLKKVEMVKGEDNYMKFLASKKGTYKVVYMVVDEWENMSTAEYFVKVS